MTAHSPDHHAPLVLGILAVVGVLVVLGFALHGVVAAISGLEGALR